MLFPEPGDGSSSSNLPFPSLLPSSSTNIVPSPVTNGYPSVPMHTLAYVPEYSRPVAPPPQHGHSHAGVACGGHGPSHGDQAQSVPVKEVQRIDRLSGYGSGPVASGPSVRSSRGLLSVWLPLIWQERDPRRVLIFVGLKTTFMLLQLFYGMFSGKVGLVSASFHTAFDVCALLLALVAMLQAKKAPAFPYAFGFDRFEVLSGFTNALFLSFVAFFLIMESFHRFGSPPELHGDDLTLAALGLCVNLVAMLLFRAHASLRYPEPVSAPHGRVSSGAYAGDRGHDGNMHGVFLHAVADLLTHSTTFAATWAMRTHGYALSHGVLTLLVALALFRLVWPLFRYTGLTLLQTTPPHMQHELQNAIRNIELQEGVLEAKNFHWWTQSPGVTVGSVHVRLRTGADEQTLLTTISSMLRKYITHLTVQIEKDQPIDWMITANSP